MKWLKVVLLLVLAAAPMTSNAQTGAEGKTAELLRRLQALEKEVGALRSEIAELQQPGNAPAAETAPAQSSPVAAPTAPPSGTLSQVLGGASLSGFLDVYYGHNFNQPQSRTSGLRAFDGPANQFALNLIELSVDKAPDPANSRLGYHLAMGFGQAMNVVNSSDTARLEFPQYLKEAYVSYLAPLGRGLQADLGKFVTPHGAEVIESKDNWNYSRGLLFTYAIPYYHFGLRARYSFSDKYTAAGFVVNGWNDIFDNNSGKTYGVTFGWNPNRKFSLSQGYMAGPETTGTNAHWRQLSDTVLRYVPTTRLTAVVNFDYGRGDRAAGIAVPVFWTGIAGNLRYTFDERYAVAARYEYFNDHDGFTTGTAQHLHEFTGTLQRTVAHHLITRLEFRRDVSNRPVFAKGTTPVTGQNTVAAGVVYAFDLRENKN